MDPYGAIKAQLIQRTSESSQQEIRKLLTGGARRQEAFRTPQDNKKAFSFAKSPERAYVGTFSSAATDLSANYLGIHHANNRRESRRSRRQNPRTQLVDEELKQLLKSNSTSLTLNQQYFPLEDIALTSDVSTNVSRPFIPKDHRKIVFQHLHGLSHPGIAASTKLATQRFVWPNIRRDIKAWVNSCHPCQIFKIHRHTKAPIGTFSLHDARFSQIHVDFIGPFPPSNMVKVTA
ncbi:transposon Tf2-6 polyprotein [Trichonephila clavipes]|uniref:RNA-directed DNA polymerase n=1 Tax=Trichonephila clavipes TaxID=2585209 RepID=A0A8X6W406_TRICX|nr:transposon Tf2-6 polyprotein [Trichonephila clavipes]